VSVITEKVLAEMNESMNRPPGQAYPVRFINITAEKAKDEQVANRSVNTAIEVTASREQDILRLRAGGSGEKG
jgi:transposase-like protein